MIWSDIGCVNIGFIIYKLYKGKKISIINFIFFLYKRKG